MFTPEQHPLYDGRFVVTGSRVHQVGTLSDASPWDHMGDDATNLRPVGGTIEVDVNERANTGTFRATLDLPEGRYVVTIDRFEEFSPCQDGGIAAWLFEHGDSGCGDANWPKSVLYVAGWGWAPSNRIIRMRTGAGSTCPTTGPSRPPTPRMQRRPTGAVTSRAASGGIGANSRRMTPGPAASCGWSSTPSI
jgi:hypothetical protein